MNPRLGFLESEIPILEAKLRELKRERKALKAREQLRRQWKDPDFRAKSLASLEERQHILYGSIIESNRKRKLPWPKGSKPHNRYCCFRRKGWTRELAIEKVQAQA